MTFDLEQARRRDAERILPTYGTRPLAFVRGQGTALFDADDNAYVDFLSGIAVTSLGHAHPAVTAAIGEQAGRLVHTSNLYYTEPAIALAERLARITGWQDAKAFFAQSGAEANEAALKLARRHGKRRRDDKVRVVTLSGSFHGRTFTTLEATGQPPKHEPFEPLAGVVDTVAHDDPDALRAATTDEHCAVLVEMVQGEGGVRPVPGAVLEAAREACDAHDALLIADEIQTGMGRTGPWFAFHDAPVEPDVITVAKALANGLPLSACVARGAAAEAFEPGDHATTFGGNPVTCAAANAVIDTIEERRLLASATARSERLTAGLAELAATSPLASGVRGRGLLLGLELDRPVAEEVEVACRERFLLVNAVDDAVVRLAPPLTVDRSEVELALTTLGDALAAVDHQVAP